MLKHVRVELQETKEGGVAGGREGDRTFALAQVLEEKGNNVVQCATATSALCVIWAGSEENPRGEVRGGGERMGKSLSGVSAT